MYSKLYYLLSLFLSLIMGVSTNAQVDPGTANLTHFWDFEDGTLNDKVGTANGEFNGNNVYIDAGDLITVPNGSTNTADSWIDLPGDQIDIGSYNEVSVAVWFTPDTLNTAWNSLWFFGSDGAGTNVGSDGFSFQPSRQDDRARTWISCGNESQPYTVEDGVNDTTGLAATGAYTEYDDGKLHHVVCQINSAGTQGEIMMYHNGVFIGSAPLLSDAATGKDNIISKISPSFARVCHGGYLADTPWLGKLHDMRIYNKALSNDEVLYLYQHGVTAVENKKGQLPEAFNLLQNYPNPFNPGTSISFDLSKESHVKIKVFDMLGKEVATVLDGVKQAGRHLLNFDGSKLSSGVYIYTMEAGNKVFFKKMTLLK